MREGDGGPGHADHPHHAEERGATTTPSATVRRCRHFSSVYDTSALSGQVGSFSFNGTATVTYRFFKNSACSGTPFDTDVRTVASDGTVPKSKTEGPLQAGSYAFQAYYSGNGNYKDATSECEPFTIVLNALTPGYWKNHMANSNSKGPFFSSDCKTLSKYGGSCSTNGPWAIQYLPKSLGSFSVANIVIASQVFQAMNCSSKQAPGRDRLSRGPSAGQSS